MRSSLWSVWGVVLALAICLAAVAGEKAKAPRGRIPAGWSKALKTSGAQLTREQAAKIRAIDAKAEAEVKTIRQKARKEQLAVLTAVQKKALAEALLGDIGSDSKGKGQGEK
jgi:hypothetical protein